jgi:hypothetical protein
METALSASLDVAHGGVQDISRYDGNERIDVHQIMAAFNDTIAGMKSEIQSIAQRVTNMANETAANEIKQRDVLESIHARFDDVKTENNRQMENLCQFMLAKMREIRDEPYRPAATPVMVGDKAVDSNSRSANERKDNG